MYVARTDGTIAYANAAWTRFSGIPAEALMGDGWADIIHPDDIAWVTDAWLRAIADGVTFRGEFRIRDRDGEYRWVLSHAVPLVDASGMPSAWYGTMVPSDERHTVERAIVSLAEAIPQLVWANDARGETTHLNRRWIEYTGISLAAARGDGWIAALHPEDRQTAEPLWKAALVSGVLDAPHPYRLRAADGTYRSFVVRAVAVRDEKGAIARWYGTATDVDDQYRAVQRRAMLDRLGAAFTESLEFERTAQSVVAAMCKDFADFAFVDVLDGSGRLERVAVETGRLTADAQALKSFAPPPDARHPINRVLESGAPHIVAQCDDAWVRSTTWSEEHYAFASALPMASIAYVPMTAAGERIGVLTFGAVAGTGRSFSAADLADAEEVAGRAAIALANARLYRDLVASESRYRGIIDTAQEGVWIVDPDFRTRYVNARMSELAGYTPDEMFGRPVFDFVDPADHAEIRTALAQVRAGRGYRGERRILHRNGYVVYAMVASSALYDASGTHLGALGMFTDITERKRIETQYRVLAAASDVLSGSLDIDALLGRFADLLVAELADEATIALRAGRVVVRRRRVPERSASELRATLRHRDADLGSVTLRRTRAFRAEDGTLLDELAARASVAIENAQLYEREHRVAATLQRTMLPAVLPAVDGVAFDAVYYPGATEAEIGGDWYDAIALRDGRVMVSIGDVTGRGLTAAVIMGRMRQAIETLAMYEPDPVRLLDAADAVLRRAHPDAIVTGLVGLLDPRAGTLTYATAGHPAPFVRDAYGRVRQLPGRGLPLGLRDGEQPPATTVVLPPDALAVFFTDGLVESTRDIAEGERRLIEALQEDAVAHARTAAASLVARVLDDGARDDVAVLTVRLSSTPRSAIPWTFRWRFDPRDRTRAHDVRETLIEALAQLDAHVDVASTHLVFGELVGNAVRHAPGDVDVELTWNEHGEPVLVVTDDGPGYVLPTALPPHDAESGRGLFLVSHLARDFSVRTLPGRGASARAILARA